MTETTSNENEEIKEQVEEREEEGGEGNRDQSSSPKSRKTVRFSKAAEVEIHLYSQGKGPIAVFNSTLGGWDQDQLEVRDILDKYAFKSIFAFNPAESTRGVPIRFNRRNGRSLLPYRGGSLVHIDGEPKDSLINPITKILIGVAVITLLIAIAVKEPPEWIKKYKVFGDNFPPWILACVVIVFTRMRKRTRDFLKNRGW
ncbi:hypothetical protein Tsubulata_047587 [Turnera subulata]|uniref:Uncharacterized protein n=1 Tax=Turnera subulata TaxID=218843 RepID=A0A9Q0FZR4_9ROSI|nr:hypothetical protein Tsubulata_025634 [Turnera subulata]KAJ4840582.1 hypothetical protein Tsubulata_047587 [Turnera subulata]